MTIGLSIRWSRITRLLRGRGCFPHSQNQSYNSPLQICIAGRMLFSKKKPKRHVLFKLEQKNPTRKKFIVEPSFFTSWTIANEKCTRVHVQENKSIYLYISLYENLFENGCIYIYIYLICTGSLSLSLSIYIYIFNLHALSCQKKVSRFSMLPIPCNGTSLAVSRWKLRMVLMVECWSSRLNQNKPFSRPVSTSLSSSAEFYSFSLSN